MSDLRIRPRQPSDLDACVEALAAVHRTDDYPTNWPADPAGWLAPASTLAGWVAVTDEETVVGHVILCEPADDEPAGGQAVQGEAADGTGGAYVSRLFVSPEARGADLGSQLLAQARTWASARRLELVLEVVATEGSAAIALYERTGWQRRATMTAHWTAPDGSALTMHRYTLPADAV